MADIQEDIQKLVDMGSGLAIPKAQSGVVLPAVVEIIGKDQLFWVTQFAEGQQNAHTVRFDKTAAVVSLIDQDLVAIGFYDKKGELVAYLTPYEQWPELNTDEARAEHQEWLEYLAEERNRVAFDRFVEREKRDRAVA